mmetsp:Transcript_46355/g.90542  ORF Transcript_46355/g.90542 Transcript_46355/m.90542 type:complete len:105 (+) Transcript_46355:696-1010(+)
MGAPVVLYRQGVSEEGGAVVGSGFRRRPSDDGRARAQAARNQISREVGGEARSVHIFDVEGGGSRSLCLRAIDDINYISSVLALVFLERLEGWSVLGSSVGGHG